MLTQTKGDGRPLLWLTLFSSSLGTPLRTFPFAKKLRPQTNKRWRPQSTPTPWRSSPPRPGLPTGPQATAIASSPSALPPLRTVEARQKHHGRHTRACMDVKMQQRVAFCWGTPTALLIVGGPVKYADFVSLLRRVSRGGGEGGRVGTVKPSSISQLQRAPNYC